jgi:hypothetical protein
MPPANARSTELDGLTQVAYRLGMAFGHMAEQAETDERRLEYFHLFDRCFFSVRVATALQLRLRREGVAPPGRESEAEGPEALEREPAEREAAYRERPERDREGDVEREPASLPLLLRTLESVAADAAALPGPQPAALPSLQDLLAEIRAGPVSAPRPATPALRSRLSGSAAVVAPQRPAARSASTLRRATGPPPP